MGRIGRLVAGAASAVAAALLLAACDEVQVLEFEVTATYDNAAAQPGDGVCEGALGYGDCTLRAAIDEANASGTRVEVSLPAGTYRLDEPLTITGNVSINRGSTHNPTTLQVVMGTEPSDRIVVSETGRLALDGVSMTSGEFEVSGALTARRSVLIAPLRVRPGASAVVLNSSVGDRSGRAVHNEGITIITYSHLVGTVLGTTIENHGELHLGASYLGLFSEPWLVSFSCSGAPPISHGYNWALTDSCALDHPTDGLFSSSLDLPSLSRGRVPVGVLGCGTTVMADFFSSPRPYDAACSSGLIEHE